MEGRVSADGHVGAAEIVVDGPNHADNVQMTEKKIYWHYFRCLFYTTEGVHVDLQDLIDL